VQTLQFDCKLSSKPIVSSKEEEEDFA